MMIHLKLLDYFELMNHIRHVHEVCNNLRTENFRNKKRKLECLANQHSQPRQPRQPFYPRLINLTNVAFEKRETNLLEKGLKYALLPSNTGSATDVLIAGLTVALERETHPPYTQISAIIKSNPVDQIPTPLTSALKSIKRKIKDNNVCDSKADKGNSVVVMKRSDYNTKVREFIYYLFEWWKTDYF